MIARSLFFFLFILQIFEAKGQADFSPVEYKGGEDTLNKVIFNGINSQTDEMRGHNVCYNVFLSIDKHGKIENICLTSLNDSVHTSSLIKTLKKTNSHWINHTKKTQIVNVKIYVDFVNDKDELLYEKQPIINNEVFQNWDKKDITRFRPIIIKVYPPMR